MTLRDLVALIKKLNALLVAWYAQSMLVARRKVSWMDSPIQNVIGAICIYVLIGSCVGFFTLFLVIQVLLHAGIIR